MPPVASGTGSTAPTASDRAYGPDPIVTHAATAAVQRAIAERNGTHPAVEHTGHALGVALGVIVTEALAAVPSWNTTVVDAHGAQVESVPGAQRIGDHPILKRHEEVVGPQVAAAVARMSPGVLHDLLAGVGQGATEAPGDSYRLEAHISDLIRSHLK